MSVAKKLTTGLTGLIVSRTPHYTLSMLYTKTLKELAKMPQTSAYRKFTENTIQTRLAIVNSEKDVAVIESKINSGQVEELIVQAENELSLARRFLKKDHPWDPLIGQTPHGQWTWP